MYVLCTCMYMINETTTKQHNYNTTHKTTLFQ